MKQSKNKHIALALIVVLCGVLIFIASLGTALSLKAHAASQEVITKSQMSAVYGCYRKGQMRSPIDAWEWKNKGSAALGTSVASASFLTEKGSESTSCANLFQTTFATKVPGNNASSSELASFMKNMGYTSEKTGDGGVCASYNFAGTSNGTLKLCAPGASTSTPYEMGNSNITVESNGAPIFVSIGRYLGHPSITVRCGATSTSKICGEINTTNSTSFDSVAQEVFNKVGDYVNTSAPGWYISGSKANVEPAGEANRFTLSNPGQGAVSAVNYLFGRSFTTEAQLESAIKLTSNEQKTMVQDALNEFYRISFFGGNEGTACNLTGTARDNAISQGYVELKISKTKTCFVTATANEEGKVPFFDPTKSANIEYRDFKQVIQAGNAYIDESGGDGGDGSLSLTPTAPGTTSPSDPGGDSSSPDGTDGGDSDTPLCTQTSGILSWVVCPVLEFMGNAVGAIYDWIQGSFLVVKTDFFNNESGTHSGWQQIRDFANIIFAILFAVVVLAQITGIGISNYNIKKMLPRLIAIAVLVNISFILCQLLVDISNVVGYWINKILSDLGGGDSVAFNNAADGIAAFIKNFTGGMVGTFLGVSIAAATWNLWLPVLLITLVSALIGVLFFFITLGVRQAGVIILIVLAPAAIVCYALPNTKSIFDKWWKAFSKLLVLYPLCGALMGGGTFAAKLMIRNAQSLGGNEGFLYVVIAMLLQIVPFFFVPTLLRQSMNALGGIGMAIGKFSSGLQRSASGAVAHSRGFQDFQNEMRRVGDVKYNRRVQNGIRGPFGLKIGRGGVGGRVQRNQGRLAEMNQQLQSQNADKDNFRDVVKALGITDALKYSSMRRSVPRDQRRLGRSYMNSRKLMSEEATAEAMMDLGAYDHDDPRFRAQVEDIKNAEVTREAKAITTMRASEGTLGDTTETERMLNDAMEALARDPADQQARASFLSAKQELFKSDSGREAFENALNRFEYENTRHGLDDAHRQAGNRALRWVGNMISDTDGNTLKNIAPSLFNKLNRYSNLSDDAEALPALVREDFTDPNTGVTTTTYSNDADITTQVKNISAAKVPDLDTRDLKRLLRMLNNGQISGKAATDLRTSFQQALTSKQNGDRIKNGDNAQLIQQIANSGYVKYNGNPNELAAISHGGANNPSAYANVDMEQVTAMAATSEKDLDRIADGIQNQTISGDDKDEVLNVIERTMAEAVIHPDNVKISETKAAKMRQILTDNNVDIAGHVRAQAATVVGPQPANIANFEQHYDALSGIKIPHEPPQPQRRQEFQLPPNWRQFTDPANIGGPKVWKLTDNAGNAIRDLNQSELERIQRINADNEIVRKYNIEHGFDPDPPQGGNPNGGPGNGGNP